MINSYYFFYLKYTGMLEFGVNTQWLLFERMISSHRDGKITQLKILSHNPASWSGSCSKGHLRDLSGMQGRSVHCAVQPDNVYV